MTGVSALQAPVAPWRVAGFVGQLNRIEYLFTTLPFGHAGIKYRT
jgi:hypothetical protein